MVLTLREIVTTLIGLKRLLKQKGGVGAGRGGILDNAMNRLPGIFLICFSEGGADGRSRLVRREDNWRFAQQVLGVRNYEARSSLTEISS